MNSVAAVHHSAAPPLMAQPSVDNKVRPSPITPVIQNTNQVIFKKNFCLLKIFIRITPMHFISIYYIYKSHSIIPILLKL